MSTSQRTFNQVKGILGKLDSRIDSLRAARLNDRLIGGAQTIGAVVAATVQPDPKPAAALALNQTIGNGTGPKSVYGRATPIRPTGT